MVKPGDEIVFANGTYSDFRLNFKANGTEAAPIILRAESPGQVVFRGRSQLFIDGNYLVVAGFKYDQITGVPNVTTPYDVQVGAVVTFRKTTNHSRLTETAILNSGNGVGNYFHMEPGGRIGLSSSATPRIVLGENIHYVTKFTPPRGRHSASGCCDLVGPGYAAATRVCSRR